MRVRRPSTAKPLIFKVGSGEETEETIAFTADLRLLIDQVRSRIRMSSIMTSRIGHPDINKDVG